MGVSPIESESGRISGGRFFEGLIERSDLPLLQEVGSVRGN